MKKYDDDWIQGHCVVSCRLVMGPEIKDSNVLVVVQYVAAISIRPPKLGRYAAKRSCGLERYES